MIRLSAVFLALAVSMSSLAQGPTAIDLRTPQALEHLKRDNPAHYEKIRQILAGLEEKPERVEADWLQANFAAQDVDLARMIVKTSNPPKQLLSFRLDQVRYTLYVVRRDMVGQVQPVD
ncbi:MAG TPA: hypothetical protein VFZ95_12555 [Steroidobacteraceae bacterium]